MGSGQSIARDLNSQGIRAKSWTNKSGVTRVGKPWNGPGIYRIISNKTYLGLTIHKDRTYPGEHEPIVSQALWDRAHAMLTHDGYVKRGKEESMPALLKGIVRCGCCDAPMFNSFTRRKGRVYHYYVCHQASKHGYDTCDVRSISAGDVELAVVDHLRVLFRTPETIARTYQSQGIDEQDIAEALRTLDPIWEELFPAEQRRIVQLLVEQVILHRGNIVIRYKTDGMHTLMAELNDTADARSVQ